MRISARATLAACALAVTAGFLVGCTPGQAAAHKGKAASLTPAPTPTPVFASDADALAAATASYKNYLAVSDEVSRDGGASSSRLNALASGQALERATQTAADLVRNAWHTSGSTSVAATQMQSRSQHASVVTLVIYVCEDITNVGLLDAQGASQVKAGRVNLVPYQVALSGDGAGHLAVTEREPWDNAGVCP